MKKPCKTPRLLGGETPADRRPVQMGRLLGLRPDAAASWFDVVGWQEAGDGWQGAIAHPVMDWTRFLRDLTGELMARGYSLPSVNLLRMLTGDLEHSVPSVATSFSAPEHWWAPTPRGIPLP